MRKISDTIARLAALRVQHASRLPGIEAPHHLPALSGFGTNPGALKARAHVPINLGKAAPLVVVLHGCTQNAPGYDHHSGWSQLADEEGFAVLFPEQQRANNPNLCFNWFLPSDVTRNSGEALSIFQMIGTMVRNRGLDQDRIFVTGLSAGGAMAAAMLAAYPEVFAGGAIIAGLPYGSARTIPEAFDRMRGHGSPSEQELQRVLRGASDHRGPWPRISIWQGTADHTVAPSNAEAIAAQWRGVHEVGKATRTETVGRLARQVWQNSAGEAAIEINMISGMGHGTPLGEDLGAAGPYMLDVGISSTREIAQFWGIAENASIRSAERSPVEIPAGQRTPAPSRTPDLRHERTRPQGHSAGPFSAPHAASGAPGVKQIIEDALRAAGLMR